MYEESHPTEEVAHIPCRPPPCLLPNRGLLQTEGPWALPGGQASRPPEYQNSKSHRTLRPTYVSEEMYQSSSSSVR